MKPPSTGSTGSPQAGSGHSFDKLRMKPPWKLRELFDRLLWWLVEPMVARRMEVLYGDIAVESEPIPSTGHAPAGVPEGGKDKKTGVTLGDVVVFLKLDETADEFQDQLDRTAARLSRKYTGRSLEEVNRALGQVEAEIDRIDELIEDYRAEIEALQEHYDWLTGQAGKLTAERLRMEAEGRAAVEAVEDLYGISSDC